MPNWQMLTEVQQNIVLVTGCLAALMIVWWFVRD